MKGLKSEQGLKGCKIDKAVSVESMAGVDKGKSSYGLQIDEDQRLKELKSVSKTGKVDILNVRLEV